MTIAATMASWCCATVVATVVRLVLVPATMTLTGDAALVAPACLHRLLPPIDMDGGVHGATFRTTPPIQLQQPAS
jgi:uncharacterized membrane protein YdfJ with MMPL/SSD domain